MNKFFTTFLILINITVFGQIGGVSISANGTNPDASAGLDVNFSNKGFLLPRLTQTQRDSIHTPALGLIIFNTTTNCMDMYGFGNWQAMSCLCSGPPSTSGAITGDTSACSGSSNNVYTAIPVSGANSYTWTVPSGAAIIAGQGTSSITVDFGTSSGNIAVSANNNCGTSGATILAVSVHNTPSTPGNITGSSSPCSGSSGNVYSIGYVAGATSYTWSVPSDAIVTNGQGTNAATITFGTASGNVSVSANNSCGNSSASVLPVTISNIPSTPGAITGSATVCSGSGGNIYSINSVADATTYTWSGPAGAIVTGGQGTVSATISFGSTSGNISVTAGNACGNSSANTLAVNVSSGGSGSQTFNYTGAAQTFTVPGCVTSITITAYGAQGGNHYSGSTGGYGGSATGQLAVTPGQVLNIYVGGRGNDFQTAGYNGGGAAGTTEGSGGGGASDIRVGGTDFSNRVIVAAGGGGCGFIVNGGAGGGTSGNTGSGPYPGTGGTQLAGGSKGTDLCNASNPTDGTLGQGGNGAAGGCGEGAGGGGGGGTGNQGTSTRGSGAGGGSSYTGGVTGGSTSAGVQSGNGQIVLNW